jgi:hypothetical protein
VPTGSTVVITYDGDDITNSVLFDDSSFELMMNAQPGNFDISVRDMGQTLEFVTGKILTLDIDGVRMFGGYVTQVGRDFFFPYGNVDPDAIADFTERKWVLRGVDFNILLDKRVLRNTANYLKQIPRITSSVTDGEIISDHLPDYLDLPAEINMTAYVDDIKTFADGYTWLQQGTRFRDTIDDLFKRTGALRYIDGDFNFHYHDIDTTVKRWGFSDAPNNATITASPATYQGSTIGPREVTGTEDGAVIVNDAFVWGGSAWSGSGGGTVFARDTNTASITDHSRWQLAETHFGESGFGIQDGVSTRAELIVDGSPGAVGADQNRGLKYPQWKINLSWFAHKVPTLSGDRDHIVPGELITFELNVFSQDGGLTPLVQLLPCRSLRISFPGLDPDGNGFVRFDGFFGLQPDDPYTLWRYLLRQQPVVAATTVNTIDNSSTSVGYGDLYRDTPTPATDGLTTVFAIPFSYISGTSSVYLNGLFQARGTDYTESSPTTGTFTFTTAPDAADVLFIEVLLTG